MKTYATMALLVILLTVGIAHASPAQPVISKLGDGYDIANLTQSTTFNVTLGAPITVTEDFIAQGSAGLTINGTQYTLGQAAPVVIGSNSTAQRYVQLTIINYNTSSPAVEIQLYSVPVKAPPIAAPSGSSRNSTILSYSSIGAAGQQNGVTALEVEVAVAVVIIAAVAIGYNVKRTSKSSKAQFQE